MWEVAIKVVFFMDYIRGFCLQLQRSLNILTGVYKYFWRVSHLLIGSKVRFFCKDLYSLNYLLMLLQSIKTLSIHIRHDTACRKYWKMYRHDCLLIDKTDNVTGIESGEFQS